MSVPRKTNQLSSAAAAYVAGLVDGEGTITLARRHANDNRQLVVSISSTEQPILDFVRMTLAVGKITRKATARLSSSARPDLHDCQPAGTGSP